MRTEDQNHPFVGKIVGEFQTRGSRRLQGKTEEGFWAARKPLSFDQREKGICDPAPAGFWSAPETTLATRIQNCQTDPSIAELPTVYQYC